MYIVHGIVSLKGTDSKILMDLHVLSSPEYEKVLGIPFVWYVCIETVSLPWFLFLALAVA
jgi:hypothetical protein